MAMSGHPNPNLGALSVNQSKNIVLLNLGQPAKTATTETGRIDVFRLVRGNQRSVGRAVGHAAMDVLTLEYDKNDKATHVTTTDGHSSI